MRLPHAAVAVEGREGYYFFGDLFAENFAQALGRRYYSLSELRRTIDSLRAERDWLAARHIASAFVVAPAKWDVYSDKLPAWTDGQRLQTIYEQLLAAAPDVLLDIRGALTSARRTADVYSRLNSHWTFYGGYVAYRSILQGLDQRYPSLVAARLPQPSGVQVVNADDEFGPLIGKRGPNNWTVPIFAHALPGYDLITQSGKAQRMPGDGVLDMSQFPLTTHCTPCGRERVLVLADSTSTALSPYLAQTFGTVMFVRNHLDTPQQMPSLPALVKTFQPTLVLTVTTERNLTFPFADQLLAQL